MAFMVDYFNAVSDIITLWHYYASANKKYNEKEKYWAKLKEGSHNPTTVHDLILLVLRQSYGKAITVLLVLQCYDQAMSILCKYNCDLGLIVKVKVTVFDP